MDRSASEILVDGQSATNDNSSVLVGALPESSMGEQVVRQQQIVNANEPYENNLAFTAWNSFVDAGVQTPINGASQMFNRATDANLPEVKLVENKPAEFNTPEWYVQQMAAGAAIVPWFIATRKFVAAPLMRSRVATSSIPELSHAPVRFAVAESATTGAIMEGALKPVSTEGDFLQQRLQNAAGGAVTFSSMTGTAMGLGRAISPVASNLSRPMRMAGAGVVNTVSGTTGSAIGYEFDHLIHGRGLAFDQGLAESTVSGGVTGLGLGLANVPGRRARSVDVVQPVVQHPGPQRLAPGREPLAMASDPAVRRLVQSAVAPEARSNGPRDSESIRNAADEGNPRTDTKLQPESSQAGRSVEQAEQVIGEVPRTDVARQLEQQLSKAADQSGSGNRQQHERRIDKGDPAEMPVGDVPPREVIAQLEQQVNSRAAEKSPRERLSPEMLERIEVKQATEIKPDLLKALKDNFPEAELDPEFRSKFEQGHYQTFELRDKHTGELLSAFIVEPYKPQAPGEIPFVLGCWIVTPDKPAGSTASLQGKGKGYGSYLFEEMAKMLREKHPDMKWLVGERESTEGAAADSQEVTRARFHFRAGLLKVEGVPSKIHPYPPEDGEAYTRVKDRPEEPIDSELLVAPLNGEQSISGADVIAIQRQLMREGYSIDLQKDADYVREMTGSIEPSRQYPLGE